MQQNKMSQVEHHRTKCNDQNVIEQNAMKCTSLKIMSQTEPNFTYRTSKKKTSCPKCQRTKYHRTKCPDQYIIEQNVTYRTLQNKMT